ncbi:hypothetical protein EH165_00990 [Nakamurella antarctica]|uniref:Uncharacterized protein n=1 Tax=Nakamurella antarctica TaxID=1902245 RepID=A0A3G8ZJK2_9ACTN|nr:hypothetical protein [Nakamurella antarctica]AZI56957.1 hypothetical protein EH165_00990 [Nakamurella antarctica]
MGLVAAQINATKQGREKMRSLYGVSDVVEAKCRFVENLMRKMDSEGIPVSMVTIPEFAVSRALIRPGASPHMDLSSFVASLSLSAPPAISGEYLAVCVAEHAVRRDCLAAVDRVHKAALTGSLAELGLAVLTELEAVHEGLSRVNAGLDTVTGTDAQ